MKIEYLVGLICGVVVGLLLVAGILKFARTDNASKCKFDERQELIRGRGFRYGYFTLMIYMAVYGAGTTLLERKCMEDFIGIFLGICISILVYAGYAVWKDGYFALNENPKRVLIGFALIVLINFAVSIPRMMHGEIVKGGVLQNDSLNLVCALMFVGIFIIIFAKHQVSKREEE